MLVLAVLCTGATNRCRNLKKLDAAALAGLRPEFLAAHTKDYTYELKTLPVRNQQKFGGCWAYSSVADLEQSIFRESGKEIDLSEQFVIAQNLLHKIHRAFDERGNPVTPGSEIMSAEWIIQKFGVVPDSAWSPRIDFESSPHSKRMMSFINHRIAQFHLETAHLVPHSKRKAALREVAEKDVRDIFETYMGKLPRSFVFEGKRYTPQSFAAKFVPPGRDAVTRVTPRRDPLPKALRGEEKKSTEHTVEENWDQIEVRIIESLKAGKAVPFAAELAREYSDSKTGIFSIAGFQVPEGFTPVERNARLALGIDQGGHAMDIVGVDVDESGHIRKVKVRNSWGEKHGDGGFDHMYADFLQAYAKHFFFR